ncbi:hypothetical protein RA19_07800 [Leisingera sp. ANG-M1]|uniref:GNAT family N-acetyltransferase n=1 Tax=Leisingera sp. ANG-M1 TaxID=1577895 RepID=UPI00057F3189|nr:GNAT family N-acetyltransferase [Leisingera sp. ANG-M1]KIC11243.1 hypothetical protein RA19_07800 [Leisingera sp. ANG-M1]
MQKIRTANPGDLPTILLMAEEFGHYFQEIDPDSPPLDRAKMEHSLNRLCFGPQPLIHALIAEQDGAPAGYALYNFSFWTDTLEGSVYLTSLFIRPGARGLGWGERFMARLDQIGRDAGCGRVMWNVWDRNTPAISFYEKLGAALIADEPIMFRPIPGAE